MAFGVEELRLMAHQNGGFPGRRKEVNGKEDMDESEEAKKTWQTVPRSSTPSYFHPYRKPKHPTKTSGHPTTTFCQGPLYILPVVQSRILRVLCESGTGH